MRLVCTLSGGFDSAATFLLSLEKGPTYGLFVDYGQPYRAREISAIEYMRRKYHEHPNFLGIHSMEASIGSPSLPWFPFRNLILASLAANFATTKGAGIVVLGSKSLFHRPEDPISYLDSTLKFYNDLQVVVDSITQPGTPSVKFWLPVIGWSKKMVLQFLHNRGLDIRKFWNCYTNGLFPEAGGVAPCPCMKCPHCQETQPLVEEVRRGE